jgi:hypothetical protein
VRPLTGPPQPAEPYLEREPSPTRLPAGILSRQVTAVGQAGSTASDLPNVLTKDAGLTVADGKVIPPDIQLGVSPTAAVEMVNAAITFWARSAGSMQRGPTYSLGAFFSTTLTDRSQDAMTDPRVLFDTASGRWFALVFDLTRSETDLAVSATSDPRVGWVVFRFVSKGCPDYPRLGVSADTVVFTDNLFSACPGGSLLGGEVTVISKQALLAGSLATTDRAFYGPDSRYNAIAPAQPLSSLAGMFLVSTQNLTSVSLYSVTGPTQPSIPVATIPMSTLRPPPPIPQAGTAQTIDGSDERVQNAIWDQGTLWFAAGDSCTTSTDPTTRGCGRIAAISTTARTLVAENELALDQHRQVFYPTLMLDSSGNVVVLFSYSSAASDYASLGAVTRLPSGTFTSWTGITSGTSAYTLADRIGRNRWGDYFGAARDPSDPGLIWFAGEYASGSQSWATTVTSMRATGGTPPPAPVDTTAPRVRAVTSSGSRGKIAHLRYRLWEDSGKTRDMVQVVAAGRRIATIRTSLAAVTDGETYYVKWRVPAKIKTPARFCVTASDPSGNRSAQSCAGFRVRR